MDNLISKRESEELEAWSKLEHSLADERVKLPCRTCGMEKENEQHLVSCPDDCGAHDYVPNEGNTRSKGYIDHPSQPPPRTEDQATKVLSGFVVSPVRCRVCKLDGVKTHGWKEDHFKCPRCGINGSLEIVDWDNNREGGALV